jgi:hypothetical protein
VPFGFGFSNGQKMVDVLGAAIIQGVTNKQKIKVTNGVEGDRSLKIIKISFKKCGMSVK